MTIHSGKEKPKPYEKIGFPVDVRGLLYPPEAYSYGKLPWIGSWKDNSYELCGMITHTEDGWIPKKKTLGEEWMDLHPTLCVNLDPLRKQAYMMEGEDPRRYLVLFLGYRFQAKAATVGLEVDFDFPQGIISIIDTNSDKYLGQGVVVRAQRAYEEQEKWMKKAWKRFFELRGDDPLDFNTQNQEKSWVVSHLMNWCWPSDRKTWAADYSTCKNEEDRNSLLSYEAAGIDMEPEELKLELENLLREGLEQFANGPIFSNEKSQETRK